MDDLQAIRGIGPKRLDKMRKYLTVGKPPQEQKPSSQTALPTKAPATKSPPAKSASKAKEDQPPGSEEEEP